MHRNSLLLAIGLASLLLTATGIAGGAPPEVCRIQGGNTKTIWGVGFDAQNTQVLALNTVFDEPRALAALAAKVYSGRDLLPQKPPAGARPLKVLGVEPRGRVMAVEFVGHHDASGFYDATLGPEVCWVVTPQGTSKPVLVRSAQPWWIYPDRASPGQRIRIFGRNISARLVALKSSQTGKLLTLSDFGPGRHRLYECWARLPEDLPPGQYELYVHNGAGGEAGWGGPLPLTVQLPLPASKLWLNVRDFGAKGNGWDDDTEPLRKALVQAGQSGGAVVHLPPGRYVISATIWVPSGVTLQGAGKANSVIAVRDDRPMRFQLPPEIEKAMPGHWVHPPKQTNQAVMVWLRDHATMCDLALESGPGVWLGVLAAHTCATIRRCSLRIVHGDNQAIQVAWGSYGFTLQDCDIVGRGALFMMHGPHRQAYIGGNTMRCVPPGLHNNLFIRAFQGCVIEDNLLQDADRNWCSQLGVKGAKTGNPANSAYHTILQGNILRNNIPRRHNSGENMYEAGGGFWHGPVQKADRKTVTVAGQPFTVDMSDTFVLVLDGRGLGQYRRVISNTADTLTVDPPWDVVPDKTTYITVDGAYVETLWIDNTEEHTANWTGFWGSNYGHVIDGHLLRDGEGLYFWAWNQQLPTPVAFCDIIGSRIVGRGQIVMRGPLVFGNTVRFSEVVDFRYRPNLHIQPAWLHKMDPSQRWAITLEAPQHRIKGLPDSAPLKDWNIIEAAHVCDGPGGIQISPKANHTVLRRNAIHVDGQPVTDSSGTTIQ